MPAFKKRSKNINLLPSKDFEKTTLGRILKWLLTTFRAIVVLVELIVIVSFLSRFWFDSKNVDLGDEIRQKEALIASYSVLEKDFKIAQNKLSIFSNLILDENQVSEIFNSIVQKLPADTQLIQISKSVYNIEIKAASISELSISEFLGNLSTIQELKNPLLTQVEGRSDTPFITFTIKAKTKEETIETEEEVLPNG